MSYKRSRHDFETDRLDSSQQRPPFVFYGTPLPPLDSESRDDGTYLPVWKQEVRDERGRKRLHGAFTGGFSAGYFNTVGSKEGWTPSTFVSSRHNRQKDENRKEQRAEDFMDDEDLADQEESQKLQTQVGYSGLGLAQDDFGRRGLISDLFHDPNDTMGVKLLMRMGWRPGQGLGSKVKRKPRGDEGVSDDQDDERLFAPDDVPMITFDKKTDKFGLGWRGEKPLSSSSASSKFSKPRMTKHCDSEDESDPFQARKPVVRKPKPKKTGFGVGILNDTGSDDEGPYEAGPKISYNRVIGGEKKKRKAGLAANTATAGAVPKPVFLSQKLTNQTRNANFRRCHDGRLPLDGFVLAAQSLTLDDPSKYAPPKVPEGWQPSRPTDTTASKSSSQNQVALDPNARSTLLGETRLPGKSIFDFISPSARDRLAATTGAALPQGRGEAPPPGFEASAADRAKSMSDLVPRLDRSTARSALEKGRSGWWPYGEDAGKRGRYRAYLEVTVGERSGLPERLNGCSVDEWVAEMREFAQAATVFGPVRGGMASRFTTAKHSDTAVKGPGKGDTDAPGSEDERREDPAVEAAKLGMYGPLTRSVKRFFPNRLTCKRFGVKPPDHVMVGADGEKEREKEKLDVVGRERMEEMVREVRDRPQSTAATGEGTTSERIAEPAKVDVEVNSALEAKRAGEELFRSIFGGDSDSD